MFLVVWDADAVLDFEAVIDRGDLRRAIFNVVEKLRALGPPLKA
jgi:hypothetical protein